ncbi:imidazoleglycerol-phosphate dehydratase HisB [Phycisphaera mikurensis]|uniref:Imidazoleglycerol-phosphate dehydratase n=1 Tax=Phycisphaera mikurensis (strain NBRC 102666 / KCTC 22515 / FYK2301M01) TaxID=1142394 RepID=I0IGI8_PHYMF|nr:imidazoleglycerol-phosphate dehydratase HisB [Phycisphaera mikurensis]MBB6442942.1 imidazoleglycerol-phosphate dehydratase [Phycisphaera mikurensis]BAM04376.1 imidazoleglycerol-phosphate dehydratase [Phycisphaera mikurensis NBRC 102666]
MNPRHAEVVRRTQETDIRVAVDLSAGARTDPAEIRTGVGFFDHMLHHVGRHGRFRLAAACTGDTHIDDHHSVEDVGIALGQALAEALGDKRGIERYGSADVPMDESLARVALDLSGRAALVFRVPWTSYGVDHPAIAGERIGVFDVQLVEEFFVAVSQNARMNLHVECPWGTNNHHLAEAVFKAFGRALKAAVAVTSDEIMSTKGSI